MAIELKARDTIPLTLISKEDQFTTRTRLQKLVFLTITETKSTMDFEFYPYDYGPFSKHLMRDIDRFEKHGLINREDASTVTYSLTELGEQALEELCKSDSACRDNQTYATTIYENYGEFRVRELLDYIYDEYEDYVYASPYS